MSDQYKTIIGVTDSRLEVKKSLAAEPTCNIAGIVSGYYGEGAKTVLPAEARVKIDFRLVPKMNPKKQAMRLKLHLVEKGFGDALRVYLQNEYVKSKVQAVTAYIFNVEIHMTPRI